LLQWKEISRCSLITDLLLLVALSYVSVLTETFIFMCSLFLLVVCNLPGKNPRGSNWTSEIKVDHMKHCLPSRMNMLMWGRSVYVILSHFFWNIQWQNIHMECNHSICLSQHQLQHSALKTTVSYFYCMFHVWTSANKFGFCVR
jgi:hypothetical protein